MADNTCTVYVPVSPPNCILFTNGICLLCDINFKLDLTGIVCIAGGSINIQLISSREYLGLGNYLSSPIPSVASSTPATNADNNFILVSGTTGAFLLTDPTFTQILRVSGGLLIWDDAFDYLADLSANWITSPSATNNFNFKNVGTGLYMSSLTTVSATPADFAVSYIEVG